MPPFATDPSYEDAHASLVQWLTARRSVLVAFSGGVDSAFLAVTARDVLGAGNMLAVLGVSDAVPAALRERAADCARRFDVPFRETVTFELDDPDYVANRGNRCYFCKHSLWSRLVPIARVAGLATIADGTLLDDLGEHRPGLAAGIEAGIASPLAECGFTKVRLRAAARARGIPFWDAPASPCLSSRIATGVSVTTERLAQIERAESGLRGLGIGGDLRVRHLGDAARVELPASDVSRWLAPPARARIAGAVTTAGFGRVLLDSRGYRRGALQERRAAETVDVTPRVPDGTATPPRA